MDSYGTCINIANLNPESFIYGPGKRFVIWVQGCSIKCPECWNEEMHHFNPQNLIEREELLGQILRAQPIDGVTVLGGEPLDQSNNLLWLLESLHAVGIHIMLYTGYEVDEIKSNSVFNHICSFADILIPGRYQKDKRNIDLKWRGSSNQTIISKNELIFQDSCDVEIYIEENGKMVFFGYPDDLLEE
jgi:Organic radical activating enzymes